MSLALDEQMVCLYCCAWLWSWYSDLIYDFTFVCCDIILQWRWWFWLLLSSLNLWSCANSAYVVSLCFGLTCQQRPILSQSHPHHVSQYTAILMTGLIFLRGIHHGTMSLALDEQIVPFFVLILWVTIFLAESMAGVRLYACVLDFEIVFPIQYNVRS